MIKKQSKSKLNATEKIAIQKHFFVKTFNINDKTEHDELLKEFVKKFHGKEYLVKRYQNMFGYNTEEENDELDTMKDGKEKVRQKIIIDLLNRFLGKTQTKYKVDELIDITVDNEKYEKAIKNIAKNSIYFRNEKKCRPLFFKAKGKFKSLCEKNKQYYANTIRSLLASYCIILKISGRKRKKDKRIYEYSLSVDKQIKNIVEYKFGKNNKDNGKFSKIFNKK